MDLSLSNPDRPPDMSSSPVPVCSGSPIPLNLTTVNRKSNPVRKLRSTDDLPPEIPEENIKTLLTLGWVLSSLKVGCVFPIAAVSILPHAEFGPNDQPEDAVYVKNYRKLNEHALNP